MPLPTLSTPVRLGALHLPNRVLMAPLTRMRAGQPGNVPHALNARYYAQRASAGLIIAEATQIVPAGQGYPATPGIHSPEQIAGWRLVTDAVHAAGGRIALQLWHVGRISHPSLQPDGAPPVAPSAIPPAEGMAFTATGQMAPFAVPRALTTGEIAGLIGDYAQAARNAMEAGFDAVEVHGANGYLLDQFLQDNSNRRTDAYGGSVANRSRLLLEVIDAVTGVWGADRVGVRLSPWGTFNDMRDSDPQALFQHAIGAAAGRGLAWVHLIEPRATNAGGADGEVAAAPDVSARFRPLVPRGLIAAGGFDRERAVVAVAGGTADAVAFGRLFIANPDLPRRLHAGIALNRYQRATFYGGGEAGYTDYPRAAGLD